MVGFKEAKQALQTLPEDWRKRALEMAAGGAQFDTRRQWRKVLVFTAGVVLAGLVLVSLQKGLGLPEVVLPVGVVAITVVASAWMLASTLRYTARVQIEVAKELQQQLGQVSSNDASSDEPSS